MRCEFFVTYAGSVIVKFWNVDSLESSLDQLVNRPQSRVPCLELLENNIPPKACPNPEEPLLVSPSNYLLLFSFFCLFVACTLWG